MRMPLVFGSLTLIALLGGARVDAKPVPVKAAPVKAAPVKPIAPARPAVAPVKPAVARIAIAVTEDGFAPDHVKVTHGQPTVLVFTRTTDATCAKAVILELGDGTKVKKDLPLRHPVEIAATFAKAGELRYACSMDMISGVVTVQ